MAPRQAIDGTQWAQFNWPQCRSRASDSKLLRDCHVRLIPSGAPALFQNHRLAEPPITLRLRHGTNWLHDLSRRWGARTARHDVARQSSSSSRAAVFIAEHMCQLCEGLATITDADIDWDEHCSALGSYIERRPSLGKLFMRLRLPKWHG